MLAFAVLRMIVRSPFGHTLVGIRESESRMRTLGYNVWLHKYIAFVISGAVGGFAGVLWCYYNSYVSPSDLDLAVSIETLLMVALGGRGTLFGRHHRGRRHRAPEEPGVRLHAALAPDPGPRLRRRPSGTRPEGIVGALREWGSGRGSDSQRSAT